VDPSADRRPPSLIAEDDRLVIDESQVHGRYADARTEVDF
jgi:hypothetical protein